MMPAEVESRTLKYPERRRLSFKTFKNRRAFSEPSWRTVDVETDGFPAVPTTTKGAGDAAKRCAATQHINTRKSDTVRIDIMFPKK